ncbi:hypothetical protein PARHAE_03259 [Paracoccus haematequi]|uniref:DUF2190 domain-containing protein n=1 Tax=Paracoccus haematequi TaxID=2491866 RepID=A0A3S4DDN6_9RHOB|nr:DUF2190 family protein [Paracoccus haematequi]VDS10048.1 hypothetical protein PARHAE_03259 [Paracoccus haematequi]
MRNYVSSGDTLNLTAEVPIASGQFVILGELFGISTNQAAAGELYGLKTEGVYEIDVASDAAVETGTPIYVSSTGVLTTDAGDEAEPNLRVGVSAGDPVTVSAGVGRVRVRLQQR